MRRRLERFGRIDVLVNNAGGAATRPDRPEKLPHELFEWTIRVNLLGAWYLLPRNPGAVMLRRRQRSGSIVNVALTAGVGWRSRHFPPAYQASKAAVIHLTRNLALSWAGRGVRVNTLALGLVPQRDGEPVHRGARVRRPHHPPRADGVGSAIRPSWVGPLLFLASDASSRVTGHTLVVDGGHSIAMMGAALRRGALRLPRGDRPRRPGGADHAGARAGGGLSPRPPRRAHTPTVSSTRSTGTRWRLKSISWVSMPSARPMSCGRCSTGMLYSVAFASSALRW